MKDSERLALTVLGWDGNGNDVTFLVKLAGTMGVDLSALTQALLREQVRREVASAGFVAMGRERRICPDCEFSKDGSNGCRRCEGLGVVRG
jgi:hypothetical protein